MKFTRIFLCAIAIGISLQVTAQRYKQAPPQKTRVLLLLDASGSMLGKLDNSQLKISVARDILSDLIDSLKVDKSVELALRVYGHQYDRKRQVCTDSKLEVPFRPANHDQIIQKLRGLQPKGTTPIAYSLEQTATDFPASSDYRNVVIIITDGIESCDGDPCEVSLALRSKNIYLKPFVIGLGVDVQYSENFTCLGRYFNATDVPAFRNTLNDILVQTLEETTVSVELLDHQNNKTVSDLNISFSDAETGTDVYDFVHYRDQTGRPDSVTIDAIRTYDLTVFSVPPAKLKNVNITGGQHNVIPVKVPQTSLSFSMKGYSEYGRKIPVIIREAGSREILNNQDFRQSYQYLTGTYDLEIFTFPKTVLSNVKLEAAQPKKIVLSQPGVVNFELGAKGFASLYEVKNGLSTWVYKFPYETTQWTTAMQPGEYKLVYRADYAKGSKFTEILRFTVASGSTQTINVNR